VATYEIECIDHEGNVTFGTSKEETGEIDLDVDAAGEPYDLFGAAEAWVSEQMPDFESEANGLCPPCPPPSVT
jgi:hypothetical protein